MIKHVKIADKSLVRDVNSKAILNTDRNGLEEYLIKRDSAYKKNLEQKEIKTRLEQVEQDMKDIKQLLKDLVALKGN